MHGADVARVQDALERLVADAGCVASMLIDRRGESLAVAGTAGGVDLVSVASLTAGAFRATAPLARLFGPAEFSLLIHGNVGEGVHVSAIDEATILLAVFDERTTVGLVRVFALEATGTIGAILAGTRNGRHGAP